MNYALIGCGRVAPNHIKAVRANQLNLAAICDLVPERIDALLEKTGYALPVDRYTDYRRMIDEHPELELIAIATDSGEHAEIALYCIRHGLHTIIEKPIAMSLHDADEIVRAAEENHVKVATCHQYRFNQAVQEMRRALEEGRFGTLSHGSVHVRWRRTQDYYSQAPWRGKWASDGGALMNQCIHGIDLLKWMMNDDVAEVYGATRQRLHDYLECEDVGMAVFKFKNGAIGTVEGTVNVYPKDLEESLCLFGETGTVKLGGKTCNKIETWAFADEAADDPEKTGFEETSGSAYGNGHARLYADMIDAVRHDRKPAVDAVAGRNSLELVLAIYKSQLTGLPVKLPMQDFSTAEMTGLFGEYGL